MDWNVQTPVSTVRPTPPMSNAGERTLVFSQAGAIAVVESGRWSPPGTSTIGYIIARLSTAGSDSTVVAIKKNGSTVGTATFTSGEDYVTSTFSATILPSDYITAAVTTAGTSATDLVLTVVFR